MKKKANALSLIQEAPSSQEHTQPANSPFLHEENTALLYRRLVKVLQRWPAFFGNDISQAFHRFIGHLEPSFHHPRNSNHLIKIFCSHYLMHKALNRVSHFSPEKRGIQLRLSYTRLQFHFRTKPVLGLIITISIKDESERFGKRHITSALEKILPNAKIVEGSFYTCPSNRDSIHMLYLELEKKGGDPFSISEKKVLKKMLPEELFKRVETVDASIFKIHQEEEILKNIAFLRRELSSTPGIPQTMIFFDSQSPEFLVFSVILLRTVKKAVSSLADCFKGLGVQFIPGQTKVFQEGEASLFSLKIPLHSSFLRTDFSINLYQARHKIVSFIHQAIGEIRDYNGGLFSIQHSLFAEFKTLFKKIGKKDPDLLENFFHAILPAHLQATLDVDILSSFFRLFLQATEVEFSKKENYFLKSFSKRGFFFVMVRAEESSFKEAIEKELAQEKELSEETASLFLKYKNSYFLGYICSYFDKDKKHLFYSLVSKGIKRCLDKIAQFQSLHLNMQDLPLSIDPRFGGEEISKTTLRMLFEGLMRIGKDGKPEYALAKHVTISSDQKQYTFSLRECFWNNRDQVTAHDFVYTWKKMLSPGFSSAFAYLFYPIKNAQAIKAGNIGVEDLGIQAVDKKTLQIELEHPCPYFLELIAQPLFFPVNARMDFLQPQWSLQEGETYVCNGPFQLKKSHAEGCVLIKNPHYWDRSHVRLDQILISKTNAPIALQMYKNGDIDWVGRPLRSWQPLFSKASSKIVRATTGTFVFWAVLNVRCFPFHHPKLRQALAQALQREKLLDLIQYAGSPAFNPLPFDQQQSFQSLHEKKTAQALFEEALKELNLTKETFPLLTLLHNPGEFSENVACEIKKQLEEVLGIHIQLEKCPWKEVFYKMSEGIFQIALAPWKSAVNDPIYTLNAFRYPNEKINFSKWDHPEYQALLQQADQETDLSKRSIYLAAAEHILIQETPVIPLFEIDDACLKNDKLMDIVATQRGDVDFRNAYFIKTSTKGKNYARDSQRKHL